MNTVSIKSPRPISISEIEKRLSTQWRVDGGNALVVHGQLSRVYIYLERPTLLYLDYSEVDFVKKIIELIADDSALLIDNEHDAALPGDQFVARCRTGWIW